MMYVFADMDNHIRSVVDGPNVDMSAMFHEWIEDKIGKQPEVLSHDANWAAMVAEGDKWYKKKRKLKFDDFIAFLVTNGIFKIVEDHRMLDTEGLR